jgi:hypothetical protein
VTEKKARGLSAARFTCVGVHARKVAHLSDRIVLECKSFGVSHRDMNYGGVSHRGVANTI